MHLSPFPSHLHHISLHSPLQCLDCIRLIPEPLQPYPVLRPRLWHSWLGQKKGPLAACLIKMVKSCRRIGRLILPQVPSQSPHLLAWDGLAQIYSPWEMEMIGLKWDSFRGWEWQKWVQGDFEFICASALQWVGECDPSKQQCILKAIGHWLKKKKLCSWTERRIVMWYSFNLSSLNLIT